MHKLKLNVEDLAVDTFETALAGADAGTVLANSKPSMAPPVSCAYSCNGTCDPPCVTGYPDPCWVSWDPAARCAVPPSAPPCWA
jgi:hypothetical protein